MAKTGDEIAGFISLTPPGNPSYSIDKYFSRESLPFEVSPSLYEIRLLTVPKTHRRREFAFLLMYAAFRWVEAHGGDRVIAIGRREILELYVSVSGDRDEMQDVEFARAAGATVPVLDPVSDEGSVAVLSSQRPEVRTTEVAPEEPAP